MCQQLCHKSTTSLSLQTSITTQAFLYVISRRLKKEVLEYHLASTKWDKTSELQTQGWRAQAIFYHKTTVMHVVQDKKTQWTYHSLVAHCCHCDSPWNLDPIPFPSYCIQEANVIRYNCWMIRKRGSQGDMAPKRSNAGQLRKPIKYH